MENHHALIRDDQDPEGFSAGTSQFDDDVTKGRYPRAAICSDDRYIYAVACDGRSATEAGLTLREFAGALAGLGIKDALNLDGGSSATLIGRGKILNKPRGGENCNFARFEKGRPIYSAIVFDQS